MAKIKYDTTDVEVGDRNYVQPQPGLYGAKIVEATARLADGKNDIEIVVEITDKGDTQGARLWSYVHLGEASRWKLRELNDAVGFPPKGEIDTDKYVGKKMKIKVNAGTYEGEYRARLQRFLSAEDAVDGSDEGGEGEDYSSWSLDDLKAEAETRDISVTGRATKEKLINALSEADKDDGDGDGDGAGEDEPPADDYDEWEVDELLQELKDRELEAPAGRKTPAKLIEVLRADDSSDPFS